MAVPDRVDRISGLTVAPVSGKAEYRLWRAMMKTEHPPGEARGACFQLRYLIASPMGILGGFLSSSATGGC